MSAGLTIEQDGSTRIIDAADRFATILALLEKGSSLSRTIRVNASETEQIEIIHVESRASERAGWKPWFPVIDYPGQMQNELPRLFPCLSGGCDHVSKI
jgi:hypothetical protein